MFSIVGLGNPGPRYVHTRHNVGFMLADLLAVRQRGRWERSGRSLVCKTRLEGQPLLLAKPQTFMNRSGEAVHELLYDHRLDPASTLVVYDEVALPFGKIRIRLRGSAGGHKGMKSILSWLGSQEVARLRIGIAPEEPPDDLVAFVLEEFTRREREELPEILDTACRAVETFLREGPEAAMGRFN